MNEADQLQTPVHLFNLAKSKSERWLQKFADFNLVKDSIKPLVPVKLIY